MSAYEISLRFEKGEIGSAAEITARDPIQDFEFPICPNCVSFIEVQHEVKRLKKALDKVEADARRKFKARQ